MVNYDIVIKNGKIIDGTGNPWSKADIGIIGDSIKKIGKINESNSEKVIDATGLYVSPGFIDMHSHTDFTIMPYPKCESSVMQGVTTNVVGNCGYSLAPLNENNLHLLKGAFSPFSLKDFDYRWNWHSFKEFYQEIDKYDLAINLAPLVGQSTIRIAVKGFDQSRATKDEMNKMQQLLRESIEEGAFGLSIGLGYAPAGYTDTEELIELTKVLKDNKAVFTCHIRNYGDLLLEAVDEIIKIGEQNCLTINISHLTVKGEKNWETLMLKALDVIQNARKRGVEVYCDCYPYTAGCSPITSLLPLWALEGGTQKMLERLKNKKERENIKEDIIKNRVKENNGIQEVDLTQIVIGDCPSNRNYEGKSLEEIIKEKNRLHEAYDCMMDIVLETNGECIQVKHFASEEDVKAAIINPNSMVISDSMGTNPSAGGKPHPRTYGTFPRFLKQYVKDRKLLSWEEAIRKITSMPAAVLRLKERGLIKEKFKADIVIFNPDLIKDKATYQQPHQYPEGIEEVIINGIVAVDKGKITDSKSGKVLYRNK